MPLLTLDRVTKLFGRFAALRNLSGEFGAGKLYAVLGDNGAGKSTLLRVIAGLSRPSSGKIIWDKENTRPAFGYMAHAPMLYDELSGIENLRYFAALYGMPDESRLSRALQQVGLDPALARSVDAYSQGMRQRLSLARAIFHDPDLLLLDEPFSNLDPASGKEIAAMLGALRNSGKTLLVVTHQIAYLENLADEVLLMRAGEIISRNSAPNSKTAPGGAQ